ncbi:hypothetical protein TL16_g07715 [Triparma laevis f. inornata]|uniref:Uncharacterized protein n=1 Tax=Triparma laevis f. inornata TaxID=1714386 RepID=A0A9W7B1G3_9STRA|nr:hypothetical protein TL16_g07715 [Triparma laevis f. inornata]
MADQANGAQLNPHVAQPRPEQLRSWIMAVCSDFQNASGKFPLAAIMEEVKQRFCVDFDFQSLRYPTRYNKLHEFVQSICIIVEAMNHVEQNIVFKFDHLKKSAGVGQPDYEARRAILLFAMITLLGSATGSARCAQLQKGITIYIGFVGVNLVCKTVPSENNDAGVQNCIKKLNGFELDGMALKVKPATTRKGSGGGGGGGGGGAFTIFFELR